MSSFSYFIVKCIFISNEIRSHLFLTSLWIYHILNLLLCRKSSRQGRSKARRPHPVSQWTGHEVFCCLSNSYCCWSCLWMDLMEKQIFWKWFAIDLQSWGSSSESLNSHIDLCPNPYFCQRQLKVYHRVCASVSICLLTGPRHMRRWCPCSRAAVPCPPW